MPNSLNMRNIVRQLDISKPLLEFASNNENVKNKTEKTFTKKRITESEDEGSVKLTINTNDKRRIIVTISEGRKFLLFRIICLRISFCMTYN